MKKKRDIRKNVEIKETRPEKREAEG